MGKTHYFNGHFYIEIPCFLPPTWLPWSPGGCAPLVPAAAAPAGLDWRYGAAADAVAPGSVWVGWDGSYPLYSDLMGFMVI